MKNFKKPILVFILFIVIQAIVSGCAAIVALFTNTAELGDFMKSGNSEPLEKILAQPTFLGLTLIISSLLTILAVRSLKMLDIKTAFSRHGITTKAAILAIVSALTGIFAMNILSEILDLPNIIETQLTGMSNNIWGILAIAVMGPLAEEVVFREGILGYTLRHGTKPWVAICISSLLFGLVHMNPAQIPFATCIGMILGYIYYRTGNIFLTSIIHIINNSASCMLLAIYGEKANDIKIADLLGSTTIAIVCSVIMAAICCYLLKLFKQNTQDIVYAQTEENVEEFVPTPETETKEEE